MPKDYKEYLYRGRRVGLIPRNIERSMRRPVKIKELRELRSFYNEARKKGLSQPQAYWDAYARFLYPSQCKKIVKTNGKARGCELYIAARDLFHNYKRTGA